MASAMAGYFLAEKLVPKLLYCAQAYVTDSPPTERRQQVPGDHSFVVGERRRPNGGSRVGRESFCKLLEAHGVARCLEGPRVDLGLGVLHGLFGRVAIRCEGLGSARVPQSRRFCGIGTRNIKVALRRLRKFAHGARKSASRCQKKWS
jgi:hypothetical protein